MITSPLPSGSDFCKICFYKKCAKSGATSRMGFCDAT
jgi:hypothetical protein